MRLRLSLDSTANLLGRLSDGSGKRYRTEIVAQRVQFLGGRPAAGVDEGAPDFNAGPDMPPLADDDDIPFIIAFDMLPDRHFRV